MNLDDIRKFYNDLNNRSQETLHEMFQQVNDQMCDPNNLKDSSFLNFAYEVLMNVGAGDKEP